MWEKLASVKEMRFQAVIKGGEKRQGRGEVLVTREGDMKLLFQEKGSWENKEGLTISFYNQLRWSLDRSAGMISLEHLRRGKEKPLFLVSFVVTKEGKFSTLAPHQCGEDLYTARISIEETGVHLHWHVIGPKKDEEIDSYYIGDLI